MTTPPAGPQEALLRMFDEAEAWPDIRAAIYRELVPEEAAVRGGAPAALREAADVMAANIGSRWQPPARTSAEKELDRAERYASADSLIRALSEAGYEIRRLSENTVDSLDDAWSAAEDALMRRADWWRIRSLVEIAFAPMRWEVVATDGNRIVKADGHSPAAALHALAVRLAATSDASEEETNG